MAKDRIPIPQEIAGRILFESDHTCCVCRDRGRPVQIHHMDEDPSNNNPDNLAVLCLLCHNATQVSGGFDRKLTANSIIEYRVDWLKRVRYRRDEADRLAVQKMAVVPGASPATEGSRFTADVPDEALRNYIEKLPGILAANYALVRTKLQSGVTLDMIEGSSKLIDVVVQILIHLSSRFPANHFGSQTAEEYFREYVASRYFWYRALAEPLGIGTGGTIVGPVVTANVLTDVEDAVQEMVLALYGMEGGGVDDWIRRWKSSKIIGNEVHQGTRPLPQAAPNLVLSASGTSSVWQINDRLWTEYPEGHCGQHEIDFSKECALTLQFTNEALDRLNNTGGFVKSLIVFYSDNAELQRANGCWLESEGDSIQIRVDESRKLVVGLLQDGALWVIEKLRRSAPSGDEFMSRVGALAVSNPLKALVRLTNASTGAFLFEGRFLIDVEKRSIKSI